MKTDHEQNRINAIKSQYIRKYCLIIKVVDLHELHFTKSLRQKFNDKETFEYLKQKNER